MDAYTSLHARLYCLFSRMTRNRIVFCCIARPRRDTADCHEIQSYKNINSNNIAEDQDECRDNRMIGRYTRDQVLISENVDHR